MNTAKNPEKVGKAALSKAEPQQDKSEQLVVPGTPIKKQTLSASNFSFALSPLPLPPKIDHLAVEPYSAYSR